MRFPKARRWLAGLLAAAAALVYPTPITATMPAANALLTANLTVEVRDAVTGELLHMQQKKNLVVDAGLNLIRDLLDGDAVAGLTHMAVGTGTAAAAASDTALGTEVHRGAVTQRVSAAKQLVVKWFVNSTSANGSTLAEVGLFNAASGGTMFARAKLATAITKSSAITVQIIWTINMAAA